MDFENFSEAVAQLGLLSLSIPFSGVCTGTYNVTATATLGGTPTSPTVTFVGQVTGFISCPGGGGPLNDAFNGTSPVVLGAAPECP